MNRLNLYGLFAPIVPSYDPYSPAEFTMEQWNEIRKRATEIDREPQLLIQELDDWLGPFSGNGIAFTILGVYNTKTAPGLLTGGGSI